ncbi:MAG TPA: phosphonate C-P lyase system protein PhnH [Spirochaetia bacterium]|jgi:alpha-D-ribose 1-methylphosphonate 5-triphosphate synthase subunit PhnH|nr:phosphonate C-P lyase system protein PhnH [Spirochaetia bacterium]
MSPEAATTFDLVHDQQEAFRGLLEAVSFPGRLVDLSEPASRVAPWVGDENPALALACGVLVDLDTTWTAEEGPLARFVSEWGGVQPGPIEEAAYAILPRFEDHHLAQVLGLVRGGTLADPHLGATVLVGLDDLDVGPVRTLRGPGIDDSIRARLPGGAWVAVRNTRVAEFPLGLDLFFFDRKGRVLALPRTTWMED